MEHNRSIVWFRNDLRIHDNEALRSAILQSDDVIPVYIFDNRFFKAKTSFGFDKSAVHRCRFIIESITDLRKSLQALGSDLIVRVGEAENILFEMASQYKASWIFCNRERTQEELDIQDDLEKKLWTIGRELRYSRGKMLYHTADLPFPVTHTPDTFTSFRKEVEKFVKIRGPLDMPTHKLSRIGASLEAGDIPTLSDFGFENESECNPAEYLKGGESEGLKQLHYYLWESEQITKYKKTRNGLLGRDFSSKFSPWLSNGCLSPKKIYIELKKFEEQKTKNDSTYWLFFELLWRDFFRLMGKKHGNLIFQLKGFSLGSHNQLSSLEDRSKFNKWANGQTGIPFIDANMRELNSTGFMSNRGRQNVASFLVNDLKINWIMGAEYFESLLIDYDPCSNYGNWNYIAGVGCDPRPDRYFNIIFQAKRYDSEGSFVKKWLPVLEHLDASDIHTPDQLGDEVLNNARLRLNDNYPKAMISTTRWT